MALPFVVLLFLLPFRLMAQPDISVCTATVANYNPHIPPVINEIGLKGANATWQGKTIFLTRIPALLLHAITSQRRINYKDLGEKVWGQPDVPLNRIRVALTSLRNSLRKIDKSFSAILDFNATYVEWNWTELDINTTISGLAAAIN